MTKILLTTALLLPAPPSTSQVELIFAFQNPWLAWKRLHK